MLRSPHVSHVSENENSVWKQSSSGLSNERLPLSPIINLNTSSSPTGKARRLSFVKPLSSSASSPEPLPLNASQDAVDVVFPLQSVFGFSDDESDGMFSNSTSTFTSPYAATSQVQVNKGALGVVNQNKQKIALLAAGNADSGASNSKSAGSSSSNTNSTNTNTNRGGNNSNSNSNSNSNQNQNNAGNGNEGSSGDDFPGNSNSDSRNSPPVSSIIVDRPLTAALEGYMKDNAVGAALCAYCMASKPDAGNGGTWKDTDSDLFTDGTGLVATARSYGFTSSERYTDTGSIDRDEDSDNLMPEQPLPISSVPSSPGRDRKSDRLSTSFSSSISSIPSPSRNGSEKNGSGSGSAKGGSGSGSEKNKKEKEKETHVEYLMKVFLRDPTLYEHNQSQSQNQNQKMVSLGGVRESGEGGSTRKQSQQSQYEGPGLRIALLKRYSEFQALYLRLRAAFDKENVKNVHQPSFFTSPVKSSPSPSPSGGIRTYPGTFDGNPSFQEAYRINSEFAQMMINGQLDQLQRSDGGRLLLSLPPPPPKRRLSALTGSWRTPEYVELRMQNLNDWLASILPLQAHLSEIAIMLNDMEQGGAAEKGVEDSQIRKTLIEFFTLSTA